MRTFDRRSLLTMCAALSVASSLGCEDMGKKSASLAAADLPLLLRAAEQDVSEVRSGLPEAAPHLVQLFEERRPEQPAFEALQETLARARDKTQDLRVAKSTFFAVASPDGTVLRNDQKQDLMAGKMLFASFPELQKALEGGYTETRGSMPEASGVKGKSDAQWVAAVPLRAGADIFGLYLTGWSFSAYAYRLETALRSELVSKLKEREKLPLTYVYVIAGDQVYGAPVSPEVNAQAILESNPKEQLQSQESYTVVRDIDGRRFGIAVGRAKSLGEDVAIALVRSET